MGVDCGPLQDQILEKGGKGKREINEGLSRRQGRVVPLSSQLLLAIPHSGAIRKQPGQFYDPHGISGGL